VNHTDDGKQEDMQQGGSGDGGMEDGSGSHPELDIEVDDWTAIWLDQYEEAFEMACLDEYLDRSGDGRD